MATGETTAVVTWLRGLNLWSVAKATAVVLVVLALARLVAGLASIWLLVAGALVVAALLYPAIAWLERHHVPRLAALAGTLLALFLAVGAGLHFLYPMVASQASTLIAKLPTYSDRLSRFLDWITSSQAPLGVEVSKERLLQAVNGWVLDAGSWVVNFTTSLVAAVGAIAAMLFLALFLLLDREQIRDSLFVLLPRRTRREAPRVLSQAAADVSGYMVGVLILGAIVGTVTGVGLSLIGVPYAILLGVISGVLEAIPYLGPIIAGSLAVMAGLTEGPTMALWAVLFYTAVQQLEGNFLAPFVLSKYMRMSPFWISLAILIGLAIAGIPGGLLALPVAILVRTVISEFERRRGEEEESG